MLPLLVLSLSVVFRIRGQIMLDNDVLFLEALQISPYTTVRERRARLSNILNTALAQLDLRRSMAIRRSNILLSHGLSERRDGHHPLAYIAHPEDAQEVT